MEFQEKKSFEIPRPLESRNVFLHVSNSDKQLGILFGQKFCTLELKDRKNSLLHNRIGQSILVFRFDLVVGHRKGSPLDLEQDHHQELH